MFFVFFLKINILIKYKIRMNKIQSESDNIKISKLIRLSRKKRNKCLKRTHKSLMWGGFQSKPKNSQRRKSGKKKSLAKESVDTDIDDDILELECEVIMYGGIKYLLDKHDNVYSFPNADEQYYLAGKKVNDYIKFNKDYQNMVESLNKKR